MEEREQVINVAPLTIWYIREENMIKKTKFIGYSGNDTDKNKFV